MSYRKTSRQRRTDSGKRNSSSRKSAGPLRIERERAAHARTRKGLVVERAMRRRMERLADKRDFLRVVLRTILAVEKIKCKLAIPRPYCNGIVEMWIDRLPHQLIRRYPASEPVIFEHVVEYLDALKRDVAAA